MAGLIAGHPRPDGGGPVGIAPGAQIYDVQVYDEADASTAPDSTQSPMTVENLRLGLDAVIAAVPALGIRIVNMSLAIPTTPRSAPRSPSSGTWASVVVAPTGNRSTELPSDMPSTFEAHQSGEDAAPYIHPADYDDVLGVNATPAGSGNLDPTNWVMENSMTDVSAPTAGAVSYSLRGESCLLTDPATSYAAAEVSGVLALLQSAYDEPIAASVRRLLTTANGRPDIPNTLVGAGEVQAMDALTRPMDDRRLRHRPRRGKRRARAAAALGARGAGRRARLDPRERRLVGGDRRGRAAAGLLLRPVLARRRRTVR